MIGVKQTSTYELLQNIDNDSDEDDDDFNPPSNVADDDDDSNSNSEESGDNSDDNDGTGDHDDQGIVPNDDNSNIIDFLKKTSQNKSKKFCQNLNEASNIANNDHSKNMDEKCRKILICSICLGEQMMFDNEIVECDSCGITVHEQCYGIQPDDSESVDSDTSSSSTEPWFCDPCLAGEREPLCELCPTIDCSGIYKLTNHGRWVHMICALYIEDIKFVDQERLRGPSLADIPYSNWGTKLCILCHDENFAQTGVCIRCDAGLCRMNFHVTCAQREGLLTELRHADGDDNNAIHTYIAYCRLHSDRESAKKKRLNYSALLARNRYLKQQKFNRKIDETITDDRIRRKLSLQRAKFEKNFKQIQAMTLPEKCQPKFLDSSPVAMRKLMKRYELAGLSMGKESFMVQEELNDIGRKWYVPPAFSVEFFLYYHDRDKRIAKMHKELNDLKEEKTQLKERETELFEKYEKSLEEHKQVNLAKINSLKKIIRYLSILESFQSNNDNTKSSNSNDSINEQLDRIKSTKFGSKIVAKIEKIVPNLVEILQNGTNEATKPFTSSTKLSKMLSELQMKHCSICQKSNESHLMILCDSCQLYYHLKCLDPPLKRMPKKTRFGGWQCSDCTENEEQANDSGNDDRDESINDGKNNGDSSIEDATKSLKPIKRRLRENRKMSLKYLENDESSNNSTMTARSSPHTSATKGVKRVKNDKKPSPVVTKAKKRKASTEDNSAETKLNHSKVDISLPQSSCPPIPAPPPPPPPQTLSTVKVSIKRSKRMKSESSLLLLNNEGEQVDQSKSIIENGNPNTDDCDLKCFGCKIEIPSSSDYIRCDHCDNCFHNHCSKPLGSKSSIPRGGHKWKCISCEKASNVSIETVKEPERVETKVDASKTAISEDKALEATNIDDTTKESADKKAKDPVVSSSESSMDVDQPALTIDECSPPPPASMTSMSGQNDDESEEIEEISATEEAKDQGDCGKDSKEVD
uniref:PHD finger protein 14 isoform X1 n=1 Tax=Psoroptes ovis TaxID=83912 RepID=A0A3B0QJC1_PSOOV|nr:PHD finger protein 14 isoform X1 [Psoroptes ovis]